MDNMKQAMILAKTGRSISGWEILYGTGCRTQKQMEEYVEYFCGSVSGQEIKVVDLVLEDLSLLEPR